MMTPDCPNPVKEEVFEPPVREKVTPITKNTIPQSVLEGFASVPYQYKIDCHHIKNNFYRINYWSKWYDGNRVVPTNRITKSFFVEYSEGVLFDLTIPPKEKPASK